MSDNLINYKTRMIDISKLLQEEGSLIRNEFSKCERFFILYRIIEITRNLTRIHT